MSFHTLFYLANTVFYWSMKGRKYITLEHKTGIPRVTPLGRFFDVISVVIPERMSPTTVIRVVIQRKGWAVFDICNAMSHVGNTYKLWNTYGVQYLALQIIFFDIAFDNLYNNLNGWITMCPKPLKWFSWLNLSMSFLGNRANQR